jgi:hypothetical protein
MRKNKTNSKKYRKSKRQKKINKTKKQRLSGGNGDDTWRDAGSEELTNTKILNLIITLINLWGLEPVINSSSDFINTINNETFQESVNFANNEQFRLFIARILNNIFNKDPEVIYAILQIVMKTFQNPEFLADEWNNANKNDRYKILTNNIVTKYEDIRDVLTKTTLQFILYIINLPNVKENIITVINNSITVLHSYKNTIICAIKNIYDKRMLALESVKEALITLIVKLNIIDAISKIDYKIKNKVLYGCKLETFGEVFSQIVLPGHS